MYQHDGYFLDACSNSVTPSSREGCSLLWPLNEGLSHIIAAMAPAFTIGWVYNLSSVPEDSGASTIVAVAVAFSILSLFACALRLYCKLVFMRGVGLDDAAVLSSFILGTAYCANTIYRASAMDQLRREDTIRLDG